MTFEIRAPSFPESISEGTIAAWKAQVGTVVSRDAVLVEVETDKVMIEVVAPETGRRLRPAARHARDFAQRLIDPSLRKLHIAPGARDQARRHAFVILEQGLEDVFRRDPLMVHADRHGLRALQETLGSVSEFLEVHLVYQPPVTPKIVLRIGNTRGTCCIR